MAITTEVQQAIAELQETWPDAAIATREDGEGGAFVIMDDVALFPPYAQTSTWVGFRLVFQYPYADVYPHFVRGDLSRSDGKALGEAMTGHPVELVAHRDVHTEMAPYERLLGDAMDGDSALFTRDDCVEEAWRVLDPILGDKVPVYKYKPGTWGPKEADALIADAGGWNDPVIDPTPRGKGGP